MLLKRTVVLLLVYFALALNSRAQIGGQRTFRFLEQPAGARLAALGGVNVSAPGTDATMLSANPALLQASMPRHLALSYTDFLADIAAGAVFYTFKPARHGRWGAGLQYQHFGDFTQTDPNGQATGTFAVQQYVTSVTHATTLKPFTLAATLKFAVSGIAEYKASAALLDIGGIFKHPDKEFYVGLALKNIGYQLQIYPGTSRESMPFDAQLGFTYKPEHMPLRVSVTAHHLQQFDIVYLDTAQVGGILGSGSPPAKQKTFGDKLARHFVISTELLLGKNVILTFGYNHLRRRELRLETKSGGAGFSVGAHVQVKAFALTFARSYYQVAGASNALTIITNIPQVFRKKAGT